jgi:N-acetylglucosaminyldiphosphoundecaprenol N-acetyl-beta-D-mannosaminyltransferase
MSVGATFAWGVSDRSRGPRWATDRGLEWLFRLFYEPGRVWRRYLIGLPEVVCRLAIWKWRHRMQTRDARPAIWFGPLRCDDIAREELVARLVNDHDGAQELFFYLNAHALNLVFDDPSLAPVFNSSSLTFCDGFGLVVLGRLMGLGTLRHRQTPPDFIDEVYAGLSARGEKVFLLGDQEDTVGAYARKLDASRPGIVAGWHDGFFELGGSEEREIIRKITASGAALLLVGMGMPRQERWVADHARELNCRRILTVGALFGWGRERRRGPRWATDHGFEWLFRLIFEPHRVWRRYLIGLPQVTWRLFLFKRRNG